MTLNRREFVQLAVAMGASLAWGGSARASTTGWHERRDLYPGGRRVRRSRSEQRYPLDSAAVRVGRPTCAHGGGFRVMRSGGSSQRRPRRSQRNRIGRRACWSVISSLRASTGYRFTDGEGNGSRVGRTITAPLANDPGPVNFAFVSCQSVNEGKLNGYRRMIFEDERAAPADQLGFVLHLGDFIYEVVDLPTSCRRRITARSTKSAGFPTAVKPAHSITR